MRLDVDRKRSGVVKLTMVKPAVLVGFKSLPTNTKLKF
jgi:hypothetical protein